MVTRDFEITLRIPGTTHIPTMFQVTQNDKDVYNLEVHITDGVNEINYAQVSSATITFSKGDGNVVQGDMAVGADSLTYTMGTNEISYPGQVLASIQLFGSSGERLTTARFRFNVVADLITPSVVQSTSEFPILQQLKQELEDIDVVELTNQFNAHKAEIVSYDTSITRDLSLPDSEQIVTLINGRTAKYLIIYAIVNGDSKACWGFVATGNSCIAQTSNGNMSQSSNRAISLRNDASNYVIGNVIIESGQIKIIWAKTGEITGTAYVKVLAVYHD